jgi:hypothetical protein
VARTKVLALAQVLALALEAPALEAPAMTHALAPVLA